MYIDKNNSYNYINAFTFHVLYDINMNHKKKM